MRPDEHKKKKNEAYKKKHGMSKDKSKDEVKNKGKEINKKNIGNEKPDHSKDKGRPSSSSESEVEENYVAKKKTYQRRKLESNWGKYELGPDCGAEAELQGRSYRELLEASHSHAGAAMSHFRFQEELEWGEAGEEDEEEEELLAFDPAELAQCLSCLPMHTVLGLPEDLFTAEELADSIRTAKENEAKYYPNLDYSDNQNPTAKKVPNTLCNEKLNICKKEPDILLAEEQDSQIETKDSINSLNPISETAHVVKTSSDVIGETKSVCDKEKHIQDLDLDSLLDLDNPADTLSNSEKKVSQSDILKSDKTEKDNDENMVKDCKENAYQSRQSPTKLSLTQPSEAKKEAVKGTDQLEDWLDSILDD